MMEYKYAKRKSAYAKESEALKCADAAISNSDMLRVSQAGTPKPMSNALREKFEPGFNADFRNIRISRGHIPKELGIEAVSRGTDILLDQNAGYDVIGHELAHVVQQAAGRVQKGGYPVVENAALEQEADVQGARVAGGGSAQMGMGGETLSIAPMSAAAAPAQCKSKEEKQKAKIARTTAPDTVSQMGPYSGFSQEQMRFMAENKGGARSDSTVSAVTAPLASPLQTGMTDMFSQLDRQGFDYGNATRGARELSWQGSAARVKYTPQSAAMAQRLLPMMQAQLSSPQGSSMYQDFYRSTMQNPGKMGDTPATFSDMEAKVLQDTMSRGFQPMERVKGTEMATNGQSPKVDFMSQTSTQLTYLERMSQHVNDEDFPEELKPLVAQYTQMRQQMSEIGRAGLSAEERTALHAQYGGNTPLVQAQQPVVPEVPVVPETPQQQVVPEVQQQQETPAIRPSEGNSFVGPQDLPQSGEGWSHTGSWKVTPDPFMQSGRTDILPGGSRSFTQGEAPRRRKGLLSRIFGR